MVMSHFPPFTERVNPKVLKARTTWILTVHFLRQFILVSFSSLIVCQLHRILLVIYCLLLISGSRENELVYNKTVSGVTFYRREKHFTAKTRGIYCYTGK